MSRWIEAAKAWRIKGQAAQTGIDATAPHLPSYLARYEYGQGIYEGVTIYINAARKVIGGVGKVLQRPKS